MPDAAPALPAGLQLSLDAAPSSDLRRALGDRIRAYNARTAAMHAERFALLLHDDAGQLCAGLVGVLEGGWLFIESLWVDDTLRTRGIGRTLMTHAEDRARAQGCHAAWLDTFQAQEFYQRLGYTVFATLEDYPAGQSRRFLRKKLHAATPVTAR